MALFDEASPICRGKNLSWETVLLFYNNMPRKAMPKAEFHSFTEAKINGWKQTHSQIARQLAFYYEENGICHPRFTNEISYADLFAYMQNWAAKYFIPNPYAPSLKNYAPTCIYAAILKAISSGETKFDTILDSMFGVELSSHDKVRVYLSNFTNLIIDDNNVSINDRTLGVETILYPEKECAIDVKKYFDYFSIASKIVANKSRIVINNQPLQQIYYGAPGTGKSHEIDRMTEDKEVIRTTFHPDSDYSTFVGCYKPTMKVNVISKNGVETKEEQIVYRFVPQAFTKAYTAAWNTEDDVYLIIEEINRGNCAQIFGDLFQLLDRKDGVSEYPVDADSDLADYIRKELKDSQRDFPEGVKEGKKLVLPSNLYIWATMNTSDQSLFPIDSAFKRRWDWKYMKIKDEHKEWKVDIDIKSKDAEGNETSKKLDWWTFVDKINKIIASMTSSADKQLGYFFCKATKKTNDSDAEPTIITKDTFVSKVIFYLWNDVFKDYGFEDASLFRYKEVNPDTNKEEEKDLTFPDFYDEAGEEVNTKRLTDFVDKVLNWQQTKEEQK